MCFDVTFTNMNHPQSQGGASTNIKRVCTLTYSWMNVISDFLNCGTSSLLQTWLRLCSLPAAQVFNRSNAQKVEFQHVVWGTLNWHPSPFWIMSAASGLRLCLFQRAWHFAAVALDVLLNDSDDFAASSASFVATRLRVWQAHLWCGGKW